LPNCRKERKERKEEKRGKSWEELPRYPILCSISILSLLLARHDLSRLLERAKECFAPDKLFKYFSSVFTFLCVSHISQRVDQRNACPRNLPRNSDAISHVRVIFPIRWDLCLLARTSASRDPRRMRSFFFFFSFSAKRHVAWQQVAPFDWSILAVSAT
jgi:hypothetical protein